MALAVDGKLVKTSAIFLGDGKVEWIEKAIPKAGPGQLVFQVKANALCGSDRYYYLHGSGNHTPGHEAAGIVIEAGEGTTVKSGARGVVFLMDFCSTCTNCKAGFTNQCFNKRADYGFSHDGGYGKYMLINENVFFPINDSLSYTDATLLLDIMGTGGHAINRALLVRKEIGSIIIAGAGPIGLAILCMAKIMLGKEVPVFITDLSEYRLDLAKQLGGVPLRADSESLKEELAEKGYGPADAAFDSSGKTEARRQCLNLLGQRGVLICVGHGGELNLDVSPDLISNERAVLGSEYFAYHELEGNAELLRQHLAVLQPIITHRFPAEELEKAAELFFGGACGKVVIEFE